MWSVSVNFEEDRLLGRGQVRQSEDKNLDKSLYVCGIFVCILHILYIHGHIHKNVPCMWSFTHMIICRINLIV